MRRDQRLTRSEDFLLARRGGRRASNGLLMVMARPNGLARPRFGFAVGKRLGKAALRNKVKRRLREAATQSGATGGWDVVVVAREAAGAAGFWELSLSMQTLLGRTGIAMSGPGRPSESLKSR